MTVVSDVEDLLRRRIDELDGEQKKLHNALSHLSDANPRKRPGRPRGGPSQAQRASAASGERRRSRKGGTRSDHALAFIEKNPGSTASQVADGLKIQPTYVYRVVGELTEGGKLRKDGRAYWPS